ncbi:hypothetical protein IU501_30240 [Nocardia otitidiscaviarum]|uniref:Uncharacterized protein n=1 Tax=Nocardia otitidiscaviarum TaxID=1823 RepID=A0A378YCB4_9NOCA|nr:hypothetical protein [Nocardia otitidiscaviarum]MBF6137260.1 hypothetical protein [Nocardia otitidiscaviarum]MBF6178577.1 hypothetical protein [Nocardia otitidiscaviarum]MBF6237766.1 hypothetical protein [Nocardia otitidiscaviarum]MBF6488156.1 hypothetical protein [Nocardia otitidiscaviarum]MCP9622154.1 hypothetical protein [Nocardia otitidiscaviarum]
MSLTVSELTVRTGVAVLDHLEREAAVPVVAGLQAQGDLIVIPFHLLTGVRVVDAHLREVPPGGIEVIRGAAGANPHVLVADPGVCRWTSRVADPEGLALGCLDTRAPAYLLHPEHGGSGIAPGRYVVRRQRERHAAGSGRHRTVLVAD